MENAHDHSGKIIEIVTHDLGRYGVELINGSVFINKTSHGKLSDFIKASRQNVDKMVAELRSTWNSIPLFLAEDSGYISHEGRRILTSSLENLIKKTTNTEVLKKMHVVDSINKASMSSFDMFSDKTAEDIAFICAKIDILEHKVRKTAFIVAGLLHISHALKKIAVVTQGSGQGSVQGAFSNLDLPMAERWYLWNDVSDEVEGRRDSIRSSRRYQMGLEDADPLSVKEGFYWRELRNEPYKFDVLYPDSPYPYRSAIWGNP